MKWQASDGAKRESSTTTTHLVVVVRLHVGGNEPLEDAVEGGVGVGDLGPPLGEERRR